jgi:hypothetical protein
MLLLLAPKKDREETRSLGSQQLRGDYSHLWEGRDAIQRLIRSNVLYNSDLTKNKR